MRAISVDRMSSKDTSAKQTRDYCGVLNEGSARRKRGYQNGVSSEQYYENIRKYNVLI
jgi:hypothetical protein